MNCLKRTTLALVFLVALSVAVPLSVAQGTVGDADCPTQLTMTESFQIGNLVFPAGSYYFQLSPGTVDRSVLMVYSLDRQHWDGIVMGINADRSTRNIASGLTFERDGNGELLQLAYYFAPDWNRGVKFLSSSNPKDVMASNAKKGNKTTLALNTK